MPKPQAEVFTTCSWIWLGSHNASWFVPYCRQYIHCTITSPAKANQNQFCEFNFLLGKFDFVKVLKTKQNKTLGLEWSTGLPSGTTTPSSNVLASDGFGAVSPTPFVLQPSTYKSSFITRKSIIHRGLGCYGSTRSDLYGTGPARTRPVTTQCNIHSRDKELALNMNEIICVP